MDSLASDEELLERWLLGDSSAFEAFFVRHRGRVAAYAAKKGVRKDEVPEVVQDIFLKLHSHVDKYIIGKKALPWFFTLVHNSCIDHLRKRAREFAGLHRVDDIGLDGIGHDERDHHSTPDVSHALSALSRDQKELIDMRLIEELSFKEIANRTGKTDGSMRKAYSRAIESLRQLLDGSKGKKL